MEEFLIIVGVIALVAWLVNNADGIGSSGSSLAPYERDAARARADQEAARARQRAVGQALEAEIARALADFASTALARGKPKATMTITLPSDRTMRGWKTGINGCIGVNGKQYRPDHHDVFIEETPHEILLYLEAFQSSVEDFKRGLAGKLLDP